jgi:hypothetical protein
LNIKLIPQTTRLKLKAKLRNLRRAPGNVQPQQIETEREEMTALVMQLKQAQQKAGVAEPYSPCNTNSNPVDLWDDLAFDPIAVNVESLRTGLENPLTSPTSNFNARQADSNDSARPPPPNFPPAVGPVPIEDTIIALPSNGTTNEVYRNLEIKHRVSVAEDQLNSIRNLIAEKSFQFSHVIRVSPRKGVTTRSRAAVKKLNNEIAEHCRMYTRCRSCLFTLGADDSILSRFQVLNPSDIAASTMVINPNEPGSTRVTLSWIWQTSARHILSFAGTSNATADVNFQNENAAGNYDSLLECGLRLSLDDKN